MNKRGLWRGLGRAIAVPVVLLVVSCTGGDRTADPSLAPTTVTTTVTTAPGSGSGLEQPFPAPGTARLAAPAATALQTVIERVVELYKTSPDIESASRGVTAAVVTDDWSWSGAAGVDGAGAALVPTTAMAAASITKTFVAAEVLRLAEAGRVDLDAPLSTYVRHDLTANGATVRQHLAMRAGAPDFIPVDIASLDRAVAAAPSRHWTVTEALDYVSGPLGHPGQPYSYSNPSFMLLGMLVEKVTGQPLAVALRRDLVVPAGLARFALQDGERPALPIARSSSAICGKVFDGFIPCRSLASSSGGAGAMAADAPTVARWGYQLYGARVVSLEVVDQMTAGDGEYGLGTARFSGRLGLGEGFGHRGQFPGYTSLLVVVPERRTSVAILLADDHKSVETVALQLMDVIQKLR